MRFRGREMAHQELGMKILERLQADTADVAIVEQHAKREGRQLLMVLSPKKPSNECGVYCYAEVKVTSWSS